MNTFVGLGLLLLLTFSGFAEGKKKKNPLQPFLAREISADVKEPSGATYCASTNSLWIICDKPSCHYIYETDLEGALLNAWEFEDKGHDDTEAVACDDANQLIYIAEEGYMRITSFVLPHIDQEDTYTTSKKGKLHLIELDHIVVDLDGLREDPLPGDEEEDLPGLEGLTWIPTTNSFGVANEKDPPLVVTVSLTGELLNVEKVTYPEDVSGLAHDNELDKLWVLSDQSERLFLTDLYGKEVIDYWDLPMENPEGIAINNDLDPPVVYIVTDPSSPHGKQYISAFFAFTKPVAGTGLRYYDKHAPSPPVIPCDGCDEVWQMVEDMSSAFISSVTYDEPVNVETAVLSSVLPFVSLLLIAILVIVAVLFIYMRRKKSQTKKRRMSAEGLVGSDPNDTDLFADGDDYAAPSSGFFGFVTKIWSNSSENEASEDVNTEAFDSSDDREHDDTEFI